MRPDQIEVGGEYRCRIERGMARVRVAAAHEKGGWIVTDVENEDRQEHVLLANQFRERWCEPAWQAPVPELPAYTVPTIPALNEPPPKRRARARAIAAADQHNARLRDERAAAPDGMTASERAMAQSAVTYDPERCATPRCKREPALNHLGKPLCQACWETMCQEPTNGENAEETNVKTKNKKTTTKTAKATQPKAAKPKAERKPAADAKPKRVSALDAAAQVLKASGQAMRSGEMIAAMADQGLWNSPNGKTPHATLYAAILREINVKGKAARFRKVEAGKFEYTG